jgi:hypothetical protein
MGFLMTVMMPVVVMDVITDWGVVERDGVSELDGHVRVNGFTINQYLGVMMGKQGLRGRHV